MKKRNLAVLAVASLALASAPSFAAIDVTAVTAGYADLETAITTVGGLVLSAAVVAVAFKWIKGMIFS